MKKKIKQAGAELGQAQLKLELDFTLIKICCITSLITNYLPLHINEHNMSVALPLATPVYTPLPKITLLINYQLPTNHLWSISSWISTFPVWGGWGW